MSIHRSLLALVAVSLACCRVQGADWPTERGDNARSGSTDEMLSTPLSLRWSVKAPAVPRLAWSSAEGRVMEGKLMAHRIRFDDAFRTVVSDGRAYFGSTVDHQVHCIDLVSGQELWSFFTGGPVRLAPTVTGDKLLFGSDDGRVYCLDKQTGALKWEHRVAGSDEWLLARGEMISKWPVRTGVLVHRGVAYCGAGIFPHEDIYLEGVDVETGRRVWGVDRVSSLDAGRNDLSPQGDLLANGDLLFVPSGGSLPGVFDLKTGTLLHKRTHSWRTTAGGVVGGTRAVLADDQIYSGGEHHFLAMTQDKGDVGFAWLDGHQLAIQGGQAYVATGTYVARLDRPKAAAASRRRHAIEAEIATLGKERDSDALKAAAEKKTKLVEELAVLKKAGVDWQVETSDDSSLIVTGRHVIVGGRGKVTAYNKETGEAAWSGEVEGDVRGLSAAGGTLLVSTDAGVISAFGGPTQGGAKGAAQQTPALVEQQIRDAADAILANSGVTRGYCLIVGGEEGDLARALALKSELRIYCVEPNAEKANRARKTLQAAGLYGHRVVMHSMNLDEIPYSNYFANLIVSETAIRTGRVPAGGKAIARHLKPVGGVLCLGGFRGAEGVSSLIDETGLIDEARVNEKSGWTMLVRGKLPGAGDWSHQYGNAANTAVSADKRIQGDLGVLWYGDPGPGEMINRHEGAVGPLAIDGKLIVQGQDTIKAYDAYNGAHLWTHTNDGAIRTGVFQNQNPANIAAGPGSVFHFIGDKCLQLDADSGRLIATHELPVGRNAGRHQWGYIAIESGMLIGAATLRPQLADQARRRGRVTEDSTDSVFAIDLATGKHAWSYDGQTISHHTMAIAPDKVCFIDSSITSDERDTILRQDKSNLAHLSGQEREIAEDRLKKADLRMAVALNLKTGEKLWGHPVDVTDCSDIGTGGGKLTMMFANGKLVLCGANANGHYWKQFIDGEFSRRRLVVLSADDGYKLWSKDANYRHRPIVIGNQILAEPWMFDLASGEQMTRPHPITGEPVPWSIMRTGHHCGMVTACDSGMLLFRSGATGFADLNQDEGIRHFGGHRLGCWINAIAAGGLVMIPEASAGCVCQFSIASTIVLEPREARRPWTIYSAVGDLTPVKHLAINLGAPGDRKDASGRIWFAYPRPLPYKETSLEVKLDVKPTFARGGGFETSGSTNERKVESPTPWMYESWASDLKSISVPVLGKDDPPAKYSVRLHFADLREAASATDMRIRLSSGDASQEVDVQLPTPSGATVAPRVVDLHGLQVTGNLDAEFSSRTGRTLLSAIEIIREGDGK
jgi:outer membrane protein assembly factor BamB